MTFFAVDAWTNTAVNDVDAAIARLIPFDELIDNLGYGKSNKQFTGTCWYISNNNIPNWVYAEQYCFWTIDSVEDSTSYIWAVKQNSYLDGGNGYYYKFTIRPVLELNKSADITKIN